MAERFSDSDFVCIEALNSDDGREYMASGKDTISILFYGEVGTGKSSLVNGLMGDEVAKEGGGAASVTSKVKPYERISYNQQTGKTVTIKIWDTPGLGDAFAPQGDENQLTPEHLKITDLVCYCFDIRLRFKKSNMGEMQKFASMAGADIWQHTVFVLSFANLVTPTDPHTTVKKLYEDNFKSWKDSLYKAMKEKLKIPQEVIEEIPIVPTGYGNNSPPDRDDWFTPFWTAVLERMKPDAQPSMVAVSAHRIKKNNSSKQPKDPQDKNILANNFFPDYRVGHVAERATTVAISTLTGAVIGTGAGIVGGPIGMGVGLAVGSTIAFCGSIGMIAAGTKIHALIQKHKEKKKKEKKKKA